jgi:hypothetical protein
VHVARGLSAPLITKVVGVRFVRVAFSRSGQRLLYTSGGCRVAAAIGEEEE